MSTELYITSTALELADKQLVVLTRIATALERIAEALYTTRHRSEEASVATVLDNIDDRIETVADEIRGLRSESSP